MEAVLALVLAFDAWVDAVLALLAAAVALLAAAVAELAAAVCDVVEDAASTINEYLALLALVVNGWEPLDVWALVTINILRLQL